MSSPASSLNELLSQKTFVLGLKLWIVVGMSVGFVIVSILGFIAIYLLFQNRRSRKFSEKIPVTQIPYVSKEIKEIGVEMMHFQDNVEYHSDRFALSKKMQKTKNNSSFGSFDNKDGSSISGEDSSRTSAHKAASHLMTAPSPLVGLPDISQLGWGHWFTLRDLELATDQFSRENIIGEGGYGIVYRGNLINGTPVAIKKLLNNLGQAEKEFRVEVDAIGHVRHKNLVRLLGYCVEGTQRMLVYEYVNNGNLDQWLHGDLENQGCLTWEARMKIIQGTAKALAYLHEAIEPKVIHRDIKSGNILIDDEFDAKVSDFGLAKLLGAGKSHITTRVMGTFGYVAPEYANTGLLNEKSDVYSFGVVLLEAITGRDPVDYGRAADEVNLVDWLKMMIGNKRSEEVVDPNIERRPSTKALKRALLTALRCLDPDSGKRPRMSQVVRMLESDDLTHREQDQRIRRSRSEETKVESRGNTNRRF